MFCPVMNLEVIPFLIRGRICGDTILQCVTDFMVALFSCSSVLFLASLESLWPYHLLIRNTFYGHTVPFLTVT